jgi:hypothetical protein
MGGAAAGAVVRAEGRLRGREGVTAAGGVAWIDVVVSAAAGAGPTVTVGLRAGREALRGTSSAGARITVTDWPPTSLGPAAVRGRLVSSQTGANRDPESAIVRATACGAWANPALNFLPLPPDNTLA